MEDTAVDVRIDSAHLFVDLSNGCAARFPLDWFPVLQAATVAEREHFAISMIGSRCSGLKSTKT